MEIAMLLMMANRLASCSEVLSRLAESDGKIKEIIRLRECLERVALLGGPGGVLAQRCLDETVRSECVKSSATLV